MKAFQANFTTRFYLYPKFSSVPTWLSSVPTWTFHDTTIFLQHFTVCKSIFTPIISFEFAHTQRLRHEVKGHLAVSAGRACDSWSWVHEFGPHIGCKEHLKINKLKEKRHEVKIMAYLLIFVSLGTNTEPSIYEGLNKCLLNVKEEVKKTWREGREWYDSKARKD